MIYAIIEASGKQLWVQPGRFYDFNKIEASPGEIIQFNKILFINNNNNIILGQPCIDNIQILGKVIKHMKGKRTTIFKMKSKKNNKSKNTHKQDITRILIEKITINN